MVQSNNKKIPFLLLFILMVCIISAQNNDGLWQKSVKLEKNSPEKIERNLNPENFDVYQLNLDLFKQKLKAAPDRDEGFKKSNVVMGFPNAQGNIEKYQVFEASVMEENLQNKHPNMRSYVGKGIDNPGSVIRFSVTPLGLHAMNLNNEEGAIYIDPYTKNKKSYMVYSKRNLAQTDSFVCSVEELNTSAKKVNNKSSKVENASDGNLRKFRLAVATTGEYAQYHLTVQGVNSAATDAIKKDAVLSEINVAITRVNGIFEKDVGLTMVLVSNNTEIIFLDAATDGFTNDDSSDLINESQTVIDQIIGSANYDIGHTFSTGGGGLASINSPCTPSSKARGITGLSNPIGDAYYVDYIAHEMGHQFGAHHTFNGDTGSCSGDNRNDGTAVEPGSGSTIMAYSGICAPQNVQIQADAYFHLVSIKEIWINISAGNSTCAELVATGNSAPVIEAVPDYTIPISTPFKLEVNATDADGDEMTYTWEQMDIEKAAIPLVSTSTEGPAFRSVSPGTSPIRYFPDLSTVNAGNLANEWEVLPSVARTMSFAVTARDNNISVGQTASEESIVTFDADSGPFEVTSQTTSENWEAGTVQTITWNVANTDASIVNCSFVNILLSTDGGQTFVTTLASGISNDGSQEIVVPDITASTARIKVESSNNIFYAVNSADINIQASEFLMEFTSYEIATCAPIDAVYSFNYKTFVGFNEETTFSATGNPTGTTVSFNPTSATANNTSVTMTVSGIQDSAVENHTILITGTATSTTKTTAVSLNVYSSTIAIPTLISPDDSFPDLLKPYKLSWNNDVNALSYDIEIATDNTFNTITESANVIVNSYFPALLQVNTSYFWRVKSKNDCGESNYSTIYSFTTANEVCDSDNSTDTPSNIPDNNSEGISSAINITQNKTVTDINLTVNVVHPWIGDITMTLTSPNGTSVLLSANIGSEGDGYSNTVFDDSATTKINFGLPPYIGTFRPQGKLSFFNGEESYGEWVLKVVDSGPADNGSLQNWSIEICGIPVISNDDDKDGVTNDIDQCPFSPFGEAVDAVGCTIFSLPGNNFNIETLSETCPDKDNGQITITAGENYNYVTTINGSVYSFTSTLSVENLPPGIYAFCISVSGESYEQCFSVSVAEGTIVSGKASVDTKKIYIEIEQGTPPFEVLINGKMVLQTQAPEFSLDVQHGDNVEVKTHVSCEGIFSKTVELFSSVTAYPNPTQGSVEIAMPLNQKQVTIELYTVHSQLISVHTYPVNYGKVQLDLAGKPNGLYIAKLYLDKPAFIKILKH